MLHRLALLVLALLVTAVLASTAPAGSTASLTGTWVGTLKQNLPFADEPYANPISVQAYNGRIVSINAKLRMMCGKDRTLDAHLFKSFRIGKGPKLAGRGGFALKGTPNGSYSTKEGFVSVSGALGRARADGSATASAKGCHGNGTWKAKRIN